MMTMKIRITKEQKIELLKACQTGVFDTKIFPELYLREPARVLTKEEARELWRDLDNGEFEKVQSNG